MKKNNINVVILNFNNYQETLSCIESVLTTEGIDFRITIVDNCSTDESQKEIEKWLASDNNEHLIGRSINIVHDYHLDDIKSKDINFVKSTYNGGYAYGNNIAIKWLVEKDPDGYIWIVNNDTLIKKNSMKCLFLTHMKLSAFNRVGFIGTLIKDMEGSDQSAGYISSFLWKRKGVIESSINMSNKVYEVDDLSGCSLFFKSDIIYDIGFIPEEYFLYYEETDWIFNAVKKDFHNYVDTDAVIYHRGASSTGGVFSSFVTYYMTRNKIIFIRKYFSSVFFLYLPFMLLKNIAKIVLYSFSDLKRASAVFKGVRDAILGKKGK